MNDLATSLMREPFDQITCQDLRVRRLCGWAGAEADGLSVTQAVHGRVGLFADPVWEDVVPRLVRWAQQAAAASLDDVAADLLGLWEHRRPSVGQGRQRQTSRRQVSRRRLRPWDEPTRRAVQARLGLDGSAPATVALASELTGVGPDRIRGMTAAVRRVAGAWIWAPTLDRAIALADGTLTAQQYTQTLMAMSLTRRPWHPGAVASLARLCGRTPQLRLADGPTDRQTAQAIIRLATAQAHAHTLTTVESLAAAAATVTGRTVSGDTVAQVLQRGGKHVVAGSVVGVADPEATGGRLAQVARRLLALAARHREVVVTVAVVHRGLARRLRQRSGLYLPDVAAVYAFLCGHPDLGAFPSE